MGVVSSCASVLRAGQLPGGKPYLFYVCDRVINLLSRLNKRLKKSGSANRITWKVCCKWDRGWQLTYHLSGTEIYSTILWHLRKEVQLSYLAQQLIEFDRMVGSLLFYFLGCGVVS